jgi:opacity protein-like surface antigen
MAALALTTMATVSFGADIPRRTEPVAPSVVAASYSPSFFVGARVGSLSNEIDSWNSRVTGGLTAGYEVNNYLRVEANYDYNHSDQRFERNHIVTGNVIGQYKIGFGLVPYALAGVGYRWNDFKNEPVWNVGAGVRYDITRNVEADLRYRYIADFDRLREANVVTLGVNYKF